MRREDTAVDYIAAALNPMNPAAARAEAIAINERNRAKARASWKWGPWPDEDGMSATDRPNGAQRIHYDEVVPCASCGAPCAKTFQTGRVPGVWALKARYFAPPSLLYYAARWRVREFMHLATNREALLDRIAVVSFCWAFRHLSKQYRGGRMPTTVNGDFADAEPVLYDVVPYFGSRNHNGFDEVEIYADVTATSRRARHFFLEDLGDETAKQKATEPIQCTSCGNLCAKVFPGVVCALCAGRTMSDPVTQCDLACGPQCVGDCLKPF